MVKAVDFLRRWSSPIIPFAIFMISLILLILSITAFLIQTELDHASHTFAVQYPGSSLAEWYFLSFNPEFIDFGPSTAIFAVASSSLIAGCCGIVWYMVERWEVKRISVKKLCITTCITSTVNTIFSVGFMIYIDIIESKAQLPKFKIDWDKSKFTREFYLCAALPQVFPNVNSLYGFPACDVAKAARYEFHVIVCIAVMLLGLSLIQAYKKLMEWRVDNQRGNVEMLINGMAHKKGYSTERVSAGGPPSGRSAIPATPPPEVSTIEKPPLAVLRAQGSSLYEYYHRQ
ncbi:hypothetical protein P280DRAFT_524270 [Massarina eburnea CBS 473.64]|uniref:Uncharacterized protein n=1 Tax=Massarina eburnea CBS 473.64 TaxID=1395130 RepID=A0A6A6RFQ4_9PLEO|nr:hypothetical protein P280DRAFT_524270 [Massarina eburnea CBS 473.64]